MQNRRDGYVRRADNLVSPALWIANHEARPTTSFMVWRHSSSNCRVDRKSGHGSMRLGTERVFLPSAIYRVLRKGALFFALQNVANGTFRTWRDVCYKSVMRSIVLKKSFSGEERKF
jgi:hypothetical protein